MECRRNVDACLVDYLNTERILILSKKTRHVGRERVLYFYTSVSKLYFRKRRNNWFSARRNNTEKIFYKTFYAYTQASTTTRYYCVVVMFYFLHIVLLSGSTATISMFKDFRHSSTGSTLVTNIWINIFFELETTYSTTLRESQFVEEA